MKKTLILLLAVVLQNMGYSADYEGTYSGTFSGGDKGTWEATIDGAGNIAGWAHSTLEDEDYYGVGTVQGNGIVGFVAGDGEFSGTIDANGRWSGRWENSYWEISGTFTGQRHAVQLTVINGSGSGQYVSGRKVTMRATAPAGMKFVCWNDGDTNAIRTLTMPAETVTYTASFIDSQKPTVTLSTPMDKQRILGTNATFTIKGTASDNVGVTNVQVQVNGAWLTAVTTNAWKNWSAAAALMPGPNTIRAFSVDAAGNSSLTTKVLTCNYVVTGSLTVQTNGAGTFAQTPKGAAEVGQNYTLTAKPAAGFAFVNWTFGRGGAAATNKMAITFTMPSNLVLCANFVDVKRPTVTITAPKAAQKIVTPGAFTVRGTALDNVAVAAVKVQLNGNAWTNAVTTTGWKTWELPVTLVGGQNTIRAYSVDTAGSCSLTSQVSCTYVESVTLVDYFPLPLGAEWLYDGKDWSGDPNKVRSRVASTNFPLTNYTGGSATRSYTTNCVRMYSEYLDRDTLEAYEDWDDYYCGGGQFGMVGGDTMLVDGGLIFPATMIIGATATIKRNAYDNGAFIGTMSGTLQLIERTAITVPAGTFRDVLHIRITFKATGSSQVMDQWWAKSVGLIKKKGVSGPGAKQDYELIQYSVPAPAILAAATIAQPAVVPAAKLQTANSHAEVGTVAQGAALVVRVLDLSLPPQAANSELASVVMADGQAQVVPTLPAVAGEAAGTFTMESCGADANHDGIPDAVAAAMGDRLQEGVKLLTIQYEDGTLTATTPYVDILVVEGVPLPLDALPAFWRLVPDKR